MPLELVTKLIILDCLSRNNGNRSKTAQELNISIRTVRNYIHHLREADISVPAPIARIAKPAKIKNRFNALGYNTRILRESCAKLLIPLPKPIEIDAIKNVCRKHFYVLAEGKKCPMCK